MDISAILMEDQTDEDFFDKLVVDEFGISGSSTEGLKKDADSVDTKNGLPSVSSFGNLSLSDSESLSEVTTEEAAMGKAGSCETRNSVELEPDKDLQPSEESAYSLTIEAKMESAAAVNGVDSNDSESDFSFGKASRPAKASVREVQWSSFQTENADNDLRGFGSYSDLLTLNDTAVLAGEVQGIKFPISSKPETDFINEKKHQDEATVDGQYPHQSVVSNNSYTSNSQKEIAEQDSSSWESTYKSGAQSCSTCAAQAADEQLEYSSEYWEKLYPGWKYDPATGEWRQLDGHSGEAPTSHANVADNLENSQQNGLPNATVSNVFLNRTEISYLQQTSESVLATKADECRTDKVSDGNQPFQGSAGYPSHMLFYEQYPGWYFDTTTEKWHQLDGQFDQSTQMVGGAFERVYNQNTYGDSVSRGNALADTSSTISKETSQTEEFAKHEQGSGWAPSFGSYIHNDQAPGSVQQEVLSSDWGSSAGGSSKKNSADQQSTEYFLSQGNMHEPTGDMKSYADQQVSFKIPETVLSYGQATNSHESSASKDSYHNLSFSKDAHGFDTSNVTQGYHNYHGPDYFGNQHKKNNFQAGHLSYASVPPDSAQGRTSAGRPLHALVTFGFGGKLVVMKVNDPFNRSATIENQDAAGGIISVHNLMDVVAVKSGLGSSESSDHDFYSLCQQSFPGPLLGGNVSHKDVHKWIDESIASCKSHNIDYRKHESLWLLLSLLKISCLHYGRLRSPFGAEAASQDIDGPESAVTKLFTSSRRNNMQLSEYGAYKQCLQPQPSEEQMRFTAIEVQKLLVTGQRLEALQCAQEGQLWGPALVLAGKLGYKFYVETVKQMAHRQLISGSPLRTLCLLISGKQADVFSSEAIGSPRQAAAFNVSQVPAQTRATSMLDDWEENLAIILANRTKDDELVIVHLGDCLWKDTGEVTAAHACYLVAEANFESFSNTARLCLIGADHWKTPRTYASPDAIQRTELYEYSKALGNSQFILETFQPYKLVYAHMLAEVGKVSESLRYCQAILKQLKNAGHAADVETWKVLTSSLEERLRTHQQGGYASNLAPAKLMGKVLTSIDRSIHHIIGAPLPPLPPVIGGSIQNVETDYGSAVPMSNESSRTGITSLMPSASMEPISEWAGDSSRASVPTRSISEPNIGRSLNQGQNAQASPSDAQDKASSSGGPTRLGRFGAHLLKTAISLVSRTRQAKLGETNKFHYDEKLRRWVEEGVDPPAEAAELAPPPTTVAFRNDAVKSPSLSLDGVIETKNLPVSDSSSIPSMPPPRMNQFSARDRLGVRSRYVDTFNKGGGAPACTFQSSGLPSAKPGGATAKFFIPTPTDSVEVDTVHSAEAIGSGSNPEPAANETSTSSPSLSPPPPSLASHSMHRFTSMSDVTAASEGIADLPPSHSCAASWYTENLYNPMIGKMRPSMMLGSPTCSSSEPPGRSLANNVSMSTGVSGFGEDLQEVEL